MNKLLEYYFELYKKNKVILYMAKIEFSLRYAGTLLGVFWVIIQPILTIMVFWLIFSQGLRISIPGDIPYSIYFICGFIPWVMFNEVVTTSINGVRGNLNLIKKTAFPSEILPIVYLLSASVVHLIFIIILLMIIIANGLTINLFLFFFVFYYILLSMFVSGISWLAAGLNVLYKDVGQFVSVLMNLWFWITPIAWNINMVPEDYRWIVYLNPLTYFIEGYRNIFIYHDMSKIIDWYSLYGVTICFIIFVTGSILFRYLKSEFSDAI